MVDVADVAPVAVMETAPGGADEETDADEVVSGVAGPAALPPRRRRGRPAAPLAWLGAGVLAATVLGVGGGAAIRDYLASRQQQADAQAAARSGSGAAGRSARPRVAAILARRRA